MSRNRLNKSQQHVIIKSIDEYHISLYTNKLKYHRNKKGICIFIIGFFVFLASIVFLSVSIERAIDIAKYANTFNNTLLCKITFTYTTNYDFLFKFVVTNTTNFNISRFCNLKQENIVKDIDDKNYLYKMNISIGNQLPCYTNYKCDYIYFMKYNSNYDKSSRMYLIGGAMIMIGFSIFIITLISFCYLLQRDKNIFYTQQWNKSLDGYSKYEYIIDYWIRKYMNKNIDLCHDIDDLIFEYTNCMYYFNHSQYYQINEEIGEEVTEGSTATDTWN